MCDVCEARVPLGRLRDHKMRLCPGRPIVCNIPGCDFSGRVDDFVAHIVAQHRLELIARFSSGGEEDFGASCAAGFARTIFGWLGGERRMRRLLSDDAARFTAGAFHAACDGRAPTLTIVAAAGGWLVGAYTTVGWGSDPRGKWVEDPQLRTFAFALRGPQGGDPWRAELSNPRRGVYWHSDYGPAFPSSLYVCKREGMWCCVMSQMPPAQWRYAGRPRGLIDECGSTPPLERIEVWLVEPL